MTESRYPSAGRVLKKRPAMLAMNTPQKWRSIFGDPE
ncbi:hypothetical protein X474_05945 [Dethiosulfatarculus sandiegensis]|uniref:Uncharacterized protein n=1 Tax=Dethiosulfatarculus sandiegensis TaxID=1429043 RepID=A0A0D2JA92_9BACT|nr:hypothetical protein X474_05945 [Dethiosulfatarculus sandiegensis]